MLLDLGFIATGIVALLATYLAIGHREVSLWDVELDSNAVRTEIEEMFLDSWNDYAQYAWGYDVYGPISHSHKNMPRSGDPMGWIIVDSIDTLYIMYNSTTTHKKEFAEAIQNAEAWVGNVLNFNMDSEINVFETTIRMLGGLLSAYYYSDSLRFGNPQVYLDKAIELGDRLALVFGNTNTGIPYSSINLRTGEAIRNHVDDGASSTAEFTTIQLEFKYLSYLTGNSTYWHLVEQVYPALYQKNHVLERYQGLVPILTHPDTALFHGENIRFGSRGDSFYEYLSKQYLLTGEDLYKTLYKASIDGMKSHLLFKSKPNGLLYIAERPLGLHNEMSSKMDHLVCFMGGSMAMAVTEGLPIDQARKASFWNTEREQDWRIAQDLTYTCYQMYKQMPAGLSPEIVVFNNGQLEAEAGSQHWWKSSDGDFYVKPRDAHNLQRPETVESLMFLYHLSKDAKYRRWGKEILDNFKKHTAVTEGQSRRYTSLDNCIAVPSIKRDNVESFWLAETLKYLYLLFEDSLDLTKIVFNTEAHPFPRLDPKKLKNKSLVTGWDL